MDKNKLIENIKNQLKSLMSSEVKFAEIKSGDLMISSPDEQLVIGSEVFTIDTDGNNIPLVDGDYTLDSGEKITVVNGLVEAIISTDSPEAVENAEEMPTEEIPTEEEPVVEEEVAVDDVDEEDAMTKMEKRIAKCESMLEEMTKANNKMAQELSAVADLPSAKSISVEPSEFKSVEDKKSGAGAVDIMAIREKARRGR